MDGRKEERERKRKWEMRGFVGRKGEERRTQRKKKEWKRGIEGAREGDREIKRWIERERGGGG